MVTRRLDAEERRAISSGHVFVWEERGSNTEATGLGLERWTDSKRWGPSRVKDEFLFYHEREPEQAEGSDSDETLPSRSGIFRDNLCKQTYSAFVETPKGRRKWHLIAYFTQESVEYLRTVDDIPTLNNLFVPPGKYKSARSANRKIRDSGFSGDRCSNFSPYSPGRPLFTSSTPVPCNQEPRPLLTVSGNMACLAPLEYLQNITPQRRHPFDEELLMSFTLELA